MEEWENNGWIDEMHPYGWMQWYCDFFSGKRSQYDDTQIKRWMNLAGDNGRFKLALINEIYKKMGNIMIMKFHQQKDKHYYIGVTN